MAKKQTRRGISVARMLYEHARAVAIARGVSLASLNEKCLAVETGFDLTLLDAWRQERKVTNSGGVAKVGERAKEETPFTWRGEYRDPRDEETRARDAEARDARMHEARKALEKRYVEVAATYADGKGLAPTAITHNVNLGFVRRALKYTSTPTRGREHNGKTPRPEAEIHRRELMLAHIKTGALTYREIGTMFDVSHQRVSQLAKKHGIHR